MEKGQLSTVLVVLVLVLVRAGTANNLEMLKWDDEAKSPSSRAIIVQL